MPFIIIGVVILLVALLAPVIWGVLVWIFNNLVVTAVTLIVLGVVILIIKAFWKFVFFETDEKTGNYSIDESGNKIRKDWKGVLEGVLTVALLLCILIYGINHWL